MSKQGPRPEACMAFRGDSGGGAVSRQASEHTQAGDRLRSYAYGQFHRADHEQPSAGGEPSRDDKTAERSPAVAAPGDSQRKAGSDRGSQDGRLAHWQPDRASAGDAAPALVLLDRRQSVA